MYSNRHHLVAFVLETNSALPAPRRICVLRGLADVIGSSREAKEIETMADELEAAERRLQEFTFQFNHKPKP